MSALEHELVEKITHLSADQQRKVLEFVETLKTDSTLLRYSPRELMQLRAEERDRLVKAAFELAADEEFEIFEAYSDETYEINALKMQNA